MRRDAPMRWHRFGDAAYCGFWPWQGVSDTDACSVPLANMAGRIEGMESHIVALRRELAEKEQHLEQMRYAHALRKAGDTP